MVWLVAFAVASTASLIPDYTERIVDILESRGISSKPAERVFAKIAALRAKNLDAHPTYNFKVVKDGQPLFFRVLIKDDAALRKMRTRTTSILRQIEAQIASNSRRKFDVPHVVDSGRLGPMVWDLEEVVDGYHLPCSWARPSQLMPYLREVPKQVRAFEAIENLSLDVPAENWTKQHRSASRFVEWAKGCPDFASFPLDEVQVLQAAFRNSSKQRQLSVVHADWWQNNVMTRDRRVPVVLDWDEVHIGEPGEMFGRHWILMCSEPRWQEEVITALGRRDDHFWLAFHAYAWMRGIDQIHYELTAFQGRIFDNYEHLRSASPKRAGFVDQMLKSLRVLSRNLGGPPPKRGQGTRRYR
jgi:hypothetical protein